MLSKSIIKDQEQVPENLISRMRIVILSLGKFLQAAPESGRKRLEKVYWILYRKLNAP